MRSVLLIAVSLFAVSTAHAQVSTADEQLAFQMLHAYEGLSPNQRYLAENAYARYARSIKVFRADGSRLQRGDYDLMTVGRVGFRCNLSTIAMIRSGQITTVDDAVNIKFSCVRNGLATNPQTQGYVAYLN